MNLGLCKAACRISVIVAAQPQDMPGHNASLAILGVFILWFGWYGFNPGSALAILGKSEISSLAAVNTTLAAAAGTISTLFILMAVNLMTTGEIIWDLIGSSNGTLAGLVSITASCAVVEVRTSLPLSRCQSFSRVFSYVNIKLR
jgi:ammonium transporter, Amt family